MARLAALFSASRTRSKKMGVDKNQKTKWGMDHEGEISSAHHTRLGYWIDVSVVVRQGRVLDDVPTWVNANSKRGDGTSRLSLRS